MQALCIGLKMCQADTDRLGMLAQLQGLEPQLLGAMPEDMHQWLLASLWNRACSHVKFGRPAQAVQLMRAALQVQDWLCRDEHQQQVSQISANLSPYETSLGYLSGLLLYIALLCNNRKDALGAW